MWNAKAAMKVRMCLKWFYDRVHMWPDLWKGVLYTRLIFQLWRGITSLVSKLLGWNFLSYKYNNRKVLLPIFKAVSSIQAELYILKVEKLDACIRPLFTNPVTYTYVCMYVVYICTRAETNIWLIRIFAWLHKHSNT